MNWFQATATDRQQFEKDGFLLVRGLFSTAEAMRLGETARCDASMMDRATTRLDASGAPTVLTVRDDLNDDVYSAIVRSRRVAESTATLLNEEVYHYHHKLMLKEPRVGGAWEWHQDYGYWYGYGCLFPNMASCYISIDCATRDEVRSRHVDTYRMVDIPGWPRTGGSSWQSVKRGTGDIESDFLNGEIVLLGGLYGIPTPANRVCQRLARRLIHERLPVGSFDAAGILATIEREK